MRAWFLGLVLMLGCGSPEGFGEVYDVAEYEQITIDKPDGTGQAFVVAYCHPGDLAISGSCTSDGNIVRESRLFSDDQGHGWGCLFAGPWPVVLTTVAVCVQQGDRP